MKKLLVVFALALVAVVGVFAGLRVQRESEARQRWAESERDRLLLQGKIDNDRLVVRSAELDEQIAEARGKKPDTVATQLAREKLRNDELLLKIMDDGERFMATLK